MGANVVDGISEGLICKIFLKKYINRINIISEDFTCKISIENITRLEKLTSVVRGAGVFRHNGGPIKGPLKPLDRIVL